MTTTADAATGPTPRLSSGELRAMVARVLVDHVGTGLTPCAVAAKLGGRSSGAVGNALKTLARMGAATIVSTSPMSYQATTATADVASVTTSPPPPRRPGGRTAPTPKSYTPAAIGPGPVTRPNGAIYYPRALSGVPDVIALRKLRDAGVAALLYGPPGTGKTSVVEAALPDLITFQGDGDTTVADFVGEYTQTDTGRFEFVHGPLVRAMREGVPLFIDDATLIPPTVLAVVYPAMDGRRQIVIKSNGGELVNATAGFYVIAGHNPGVHGAILTDALSSRFSAQIHVPSDYTIATQLGIDRRAVLLARNLATRQATGHIGWAPQLRELIAFQKITDVLGLEAATANLVGIAPEEDRAVVIAAVRDAFGKPVSPLALGDRI